MSRPGRLALGRGWLVGGTGALLLGFGAWMWATSLLPTSYSMTAMGYPDYGGGPVPAAGPGSSHQHGGVDVTTLIPDPRRPADVRVDLVARAERVTLPGVVEPFDGFTLNGRTPGPTIRAHAGELVEVRVTNQDVPDGMTLHWHGVDLPNAMDGVAGVTQDAIAPGRQYVYRFVAQEGTYWYHSHQVPHPQVSRGLLGALVVEGTPEPRGVDVIALVHSYGGRRTINGQPGEVAARASPGDAVRVRVINTDAGPMPVWASGTSYRVAAIDGRELNRPDPSRIRHWWSPPAVGRTWSWWCRRAVSGWSSPGLR